VLKSTRSHRDPFPGKVASIGTDSTRPELGYRCRKLVRVLEGDILRVEVPQFDRGNVSGFSPAYVSFIIATPKVKINHKADWWLGRLDDEWFEFLEASVREEWGVTPLRIREGGVSLLLQVRRVYC